MVILEHIYHHMIVIAHCQSLSRRPAAGGSLLGIGSDVGGSLRIPAHFSGFVRTFLVHLSEVRSHRFLPLWNIPTFFTFSSIFQAVLGWSRPRKLIRRRKWKAEKRFNILAPKRSASRIYEGGRRAGVGAGSKSVRLTILVMIASIMIIIMMMLIFYLCIRTGFYSAAGFMASSVSGIEVFLPYSLSLPFSYSSSPLPYSLNHHVHQKQQPHNYW